jgi:RNA polymerase sigma-B factor
LQQLLLQQLLLRHQHRGGLEAREAGAAYRADSLDRPASEDEQDGARVVDALGGDDPGFGRAEQSATLERLMRALTDRQREILRLRFSEDLTQSEIGERVGLSQMQISRLVRQAIGRLRETAERHAPAEPPRDAVGG